MDLVEQLSDHGYLGVFLSAFFEFIGVPVPSLAILLGVGALAQGAELSLPLLVLLAAVGAVVADVVWFQVGRHYSEPLLRFYAWFSMGTQHCTSRTQRFFERYGLRSLLFAKFVPGFSTFAAPMAGRAGVSLGQFLLWDTLGSVIWAATLLGVGSTMSLAQVQELEGEIGEAMSWIAPFVLTLIVSIVVFKVVRLVLKGRARTSDVLDPGFSRITFSGIENE
jgi:membrane protein DedA with SNARE-associated domain